MTTFLTLIVLGYLLWIAIFLGYERLQRRKKERRSEYVLPCKQAKSVDILGKSTFSLSHSTPQVPQKNENEKAIVEADTFAAETEKYPKIVSVEELDKLFAEGQELPQELELVDNEPMEYKEAEEEDETPPIDEEEQDTCLAGCVPQATGIRFEEMGLAVRVATNGDAANERERLQAGKTLAELKGTPLFDQLVAGDAEREKRIDSLIEQHLATFRQRHLPADEVSTEDIPDTFSISDIV